MFAMDYSKLAVRPLTTFTFLIDCSTAIISGMSIRPCALKSLGLIEVHKTLHGYLSGYRPNPLMLQINSKSVRLLRSHAQILTHHRCHLQGFSSLHCVLQVR